MNVEIIVKIEGREAVAIHQELSLAEAMAIEAQTERVKGWLGQVEPTPPCQPTEDQPVTKSNRPFRPPLNGRTPRKGKRSQCRKL